MCIAQVDVIEVDNTIGGYYKAAVFFNATCLGIAGDLRRAVRSVDAGDGDGERVLIAG